MLTRIGIVGRITDNAPGKGRMERRLDIEEGNEDSEPTRVIQSLAEFKQMDVWGHEALLDEDDAFIRGIQEWVGFSEAIHTAGKSA